jgi:hypothetical protein
MLYVRVGRPVKPKRHGTPSELYSCASDSQILAS